MENLIQLFFSAPSNCHQDRYREYEAMLISGEESSNYCLHKMRREIENWIDPITSAHNCSPFEKYGMSITINDACFFLDYEGDTLEIMHDDTDDLITIIEACNNDDFSKIKEAVNEL